MRKVHLWLSLLLGLPIIIIAATGLPMTYWYEADAIFDPAFYQNDWRGGPRATLDELVAAARTAPGVTEVKSIALPRNGANPQASVTIEGQSAPEVSLDPGSARIVAVRDLDGTAIVWLYSLHSRLLLDRIGASEVGQVAIVVLALSFAGLIVTGAVIWWPRKAVLAGLAPRVRRGFFWRDTHTTAGLYAGLPLFAAAVTTALPSFPETGGTGASPAQSLSGLERSNGAPGSCDRIETIAQAARGGASVVQSVWRLQPGGAGQALHVLMGHSASGGYRWVAVDRKTCAPLTLCTARPEIVPNEDTSLLINIHQGHVLGEIGRFLFALASILPVLLYATGLVLWGRRKIRRDASVPRAID